MKQSVKHSACQNSQLVAMNWNALYLDTFAGILGEPENKC